MDDRPSAPAAPPATFRHHGLLGTVIELRISTAHDASDDPDEQATADALADEVDALVVTEIERLQAIFNARDPASELRRWCRGDTAPSAELVEVVALAQRWVERSHGAFDPRVGRLVACWNEAAADGRLPHQTELAAALGELDRPFGSAADTELDLSAIAKGWIVDRSVALGAAHPGVTALTVNAGGDLRHVGAGSLLVGIEDPHRPYDNVAPLVAVRLANGALATSGGARRGWRIADCWYPHVLDPRTGWPVDHVASASVLAPDATTADAVATVLTVEPVADGLAFVAGLDGVECFVVERDGGQHRSAGWPPDERTAGVRPAS